MTARFETTGEYRSSANAKGSSSDGAVGESSATSLRDAGSLSIPDRALYALFARHADRRRHETDRHRYRGTDLGVSFDLFLARTYGISWLVALLAFVPAFVAAAALSPTALDTVAAFLEAGVPGLSRGSLPTLPRAAFAVGSAMTAALSAKRAVVACGGLYLRWMTAARQANIERTLPGAARYLRALSSGSDDPRGMLEKVAANDAYGETAVSIRKALKRRSSRSGLAEAATDETSHVRPRTHIARRGETTLRQGSA